MSAVVLTVVAVTAGCSSDAPKPRDVIAYATSQVPVPGSDQSLREAARRFEGYVADGTAVGAFMNLSIRCRARIGGLDAYRADMKTGRRPLGEVVSSAVDGTLGRVTMWAGPDRTVDTHWVLAEGIWQNDDC